MVRVGLNGTSSSRRFDGRCVKTIVLIRPNRLASRPDTSYEADWRSAMNANVGPRKVVPAPKRA